MTPSHDSSTQSFAIYATVSQKERGFTLLEVMIALVIFAICAATLIQQSGRSTKQALQLDERMKANWIAENELERIRLAGYPEAGQKTRELLFAKQTWLVKSDVTNTTHPDLRKVIVSVAPLLESAREDSPNHYNLTGFLGRY